MTRGLAVLVGVALAIGGASRAHAHDLRPGVLSFVERADGEIALRFIPPVDSRGDLVELVIELPPGCTRTDTAVRCDRGLAGDLALVGMRGDAMRTVVTIQRPGGETAEWILSASSPRITIGRTAPRTALPWIIIGVEHILGGLDHVAFVIGLLLVLQIVVNRRLLLTITAFTLAHSLTLALAVLGVIAVPIAPVEAWIAASVLLVAREATHSGPTAIRRWPWLAAGAFGLIHGLGFASALGEIGLPRAALAWSLVWFNVGVELGQLAVVVVIVAIAWIGRRSIGKRWNVGPHVYRAVCYILGTLAAWWLLTRVVELACGSR